MAAPNPAAQGVAGSLGDLPFANPEFQSGDFPVKTAHGDLDADGDQDVVAATAGDFDFIGFHTGETITVHHNLGGGLLAELGQGGAALALPTKIGPTAVAVADFDGDLDLDIASADNESARVTLQRNAGDGQTFAAFSFPAGPDPFALAAGDLDGDGDPDLAVTNLGTSIAPLSTVSLLFVGPTGAGEPVMVQVGQRPSGVAIADLDLDGKNDLAVGNFQGGSVTVVSNQGSGLFVRSQELDSSSGFNEGPSAIAAGDLDGDGLPDLAVTEDGFFPAPQGSLAVFLTQGDAAFGSAILLGEGARTDLRMADLDHDGDLDVATATDGGVLSVFVNDGQAGLTEAGFELGATTGGIDLVDLDADGHLDAVACDEGTDMLAVARGRGDATFDTNQRQALAQPPNGMTLTDVDGDGLRDLLLPGFNALEIRPGAPDGTFGAADIVPLGLTSALHSFADDLDGDGDLDLATLGLNSMLSVRVGSGAGSFPFEALTAIPELRTVSMAPGDLDRDGDTDFAVVVQLPATAVRVLSNNGDATFTVGSALPFDAGGAPFGFGDFRTESALADLDRDGTLDLLVMPDDGPGDFSIGFPNDRLLVFLGHGDGTFDPASPFPLPIESHGLALGDADGDGALDVVVAVTGLPTFEGFFTGSSVVLLRGNGDGTFQPFEELETELGPLAVAIGDFDADGDGDIASANSVHNVSLLANDGSGSFAKAGKFGGLFGPLELAAADLNGDGRVDLVSAHEAFNAVMVLLGQGQGITPYGCDVNPPGSLGVLAGSPTLGTSLTLGVDNPLGTQTPGALTLLALATAPDPAFPCGTLVPGFGMAGPGADGEILLSLAPSPLLFTGPPFAGSGNPSAFVLPIPDDATLLGALVFAQGVIVDPAGVTGVAVGFTDGLRIELGAP